ncbi:MAG TPA: triose-phosphate isomerase [Gaiellales bacterium]
MSRRPFVAGNWKMYKTAAEAVAFVEALAGRVPEDVDVGICPAYTALAETVRAAAGSGIAVYAQNMHQAEAGAFTGEVSAGMLLAAGVDGVLVGHSERRQLFGETDQGVNEKVLRAHAAGLRVILAVGETAEEREAALTEIVLERQLRAGLDGLSGAQVAATTIAYEPVWAIGTGQTATPAIAQAAHAFIRGLVDGVHGTGAQVRIQYGGSVKPGNAAELFAQPDIDGGLIGGASLEAGDFAAIAAAAGG